MNWNPPVLMVSVASRTGKHKNLHVRTITRDGYAGWYVEVGLHQLGELCVHVGAVGGEQVRDIDCEAAAIQRRHSTSSLGNQ